jgi:hypothetical protein
MEQLKFDFNFGAKLSIYEFVELSGISQSALRSWIRRNKITPIGMKEKIKTQTPYTYLYDYETLKAYSPKFSRKGN